MAKRERQPPSPDELERMADHIGDALVDMLRGDAMWTYQHNRYAGLASMTYARSLIEFLVGRDRDRNPSDVWPTDFVQEWRVDDDESKLLRGQLTVPDTQLAHLSLARVRDSGERPIGWSATIERITALTERFSIEAASAPGGTQIIAAVGRGRALAEDVRRSARP
jgi:hypothetical protein